jgi:uncharacterized protein YwqG
VAVTRHSVLIGYTGGKPYLQLVDVDVARTVSLATPLDSRDYAVDSAYVRDDYVVLRSGTDFAAAVPSDLRSGATRLGAAWSVVPAADPGLVWLWQPARRYHEKPSTCVLVDGTGGERDRFELPAGYRLEGDTDHGLVVRDDLGFGLWDRGSEWFARAQSGRAVFVHRDGLILVSSDDGLSVWDLAADDVRPLEPPDGVERPFFVDAAPSSTLIAWKSDRHRAEHDSDVVIADLAGPAVVAVVPVELPFLGSLCWSHDARWLYASFWEDPIVRCFSADASVIEDVHFAKRVGNLLCDLGSVPAPLTTKRLLIDYDGAAAGRLAPTSSEKSLRTAVAAVLRDELGPSVTTAIMNVTRPGVRLVANDSGRSQIGGMPRLPSAVAWPRRDGTPLSLLAQVDLGEVRRAWRTSPFPTSGSLAFFYGPMNNAGLITDDAVVLHLWDGSEETADDEHARVFDAVAVRPQLILTLPAELDEAIGEDVAEAARNLFAEMFANTSGASHQMGGHASWIQGGAPGELLLQVDCDSEAGMEWGDGGRVYFLLPQAQLDAGSFDRATAIEECY